MLDRIRFAGVILSPRQMSFPIQLTNDAYRGKLFDFLIGGAQRGESNLLRELCEAGIGQQRHVTQQLVDGIAARRRGKHLVSIKQLGDT